MSRSQTPEDLPKIIQQMEDRLERLELGGVSDAPTWDSGWIADSLAAGGGPRTYVHGLGLLSPPRMFKMWFTPDKVLWYPVGEGRGMSTESMTPSVQSNYRNPSFVEVTANAFRVGVYVSAGTTGLPLFSIYTGVAWNNYNTGFWRAFIWR